MVESTDRKEGHIKGDSIYLNILPMKYILPMFKETPGTTNRLKKGDARGTQQKKCFHFVMKSLLCLTLSRFEEHL